ncbi:MFS transporter [Nostocoides australiense]|nr:MFS transporter [Tetrasphaera australiensis]
MRRARTPPRCSTCSARTRRTLLTLGLGASAISALRGIRLSVLPPWADHIGLPAAQLSLLVALGALVEIAICYPAGWVMDRRGRVWVAVPTAVLLGLGLMLIPVTGSFGELLAATVVMAVGNGLGSGIVMTLGADTAPRLHRAKYLGGWRLFADIGMSGGPLTVSGLAALAGLASVILGVGGVLAAGWPWRWVGPVDRRRRADERMPA